MPYIGEALPPPRAAASLCHITDANPSFGAAPAFAIFESFPAGAIYSRPKRRWEASYGCDSGVAESQTATFSLEETALCVQPGAISRAGLGMASRAK